MEAGPCQGPSRFQCAYGWLCLAPTNSAARFQTELAIDTNIVVSDTQTAVADALTVVTDTRTMVADIHRSVLTVQDDTSSKNRSVGAVIIDK